MSDTFKGTMVILFILVVLGVVGEQDFKDECRMDKECTEKYLTEH